MMMVIYSVNQKHWGRLKLPVNAIHWSLSIVTYGAPAPYVRKYAYVQLIVPVLLYESEMWTMTKALDKKVDVVPTAAALHQLYTARLQPGCMRSDRLY